MPSILSILRYQGAKNTKTSVNLSYFNIEAVYLELVSIKAIYIETIYLELVSIRTVRIAAIYLELISIRIIYIGAVYIEAIRIRATSIEIAVYIEAVLSSGIYYLVYSDNIRYR